MLWHKVWFFFFFFSWQNEQMKIVLLAIFCLFTYKTWPKLISFVGHMHTSHSHGIIGQGLVIKIGADANCTTKKMGSKLGPNFWGCFFQGLLEASFIFLRDQKVEKMNDFFYQLLQDFFCCFQGGVGMLLLILNSYLENIFFKFS